MDELSKKRLEYLRGISPKDMSDEQKRFILARRSYLTLDDKEKFKEILKKEVKEVKKE